MHGHMPISIFNAYSMPSAASLARSEAAQRAGETRRKLLGSVSDAIEEAPAEVSLTVGQWPGAGSQRRAGGGAGSGRSEAAEEEPEGMVEPISVWA